MVLGALRVRAKAGRWEPERPETKSLWLLPSGSDQVGDSLVRPTPAAHMGEDLGTRKLPHISALH